LPLSLLIGGILAALRQIFHLSACPNLAGHLSFPFAFGDLVLADLPRTCGSCEFHLK
jgi:hypothetical protein